MSAESKLQLAEAYMQIVPSMRGTQGVIAKELGAVDGEGRRAGARLGDGMHGGIRGRLAALVPGSGAGIGGALGGSILGAVKRFAAPIAAAAVGLASVEAVKKSVETFEATAGATRSLQRTIGGTVPQVSSLVGALQLGGVEGNKAQLALTIFSKTVGKAGIDTKHTAALTKTLGFSFKDAHGQILPMASLLPKVSDKFAKMPDGPAKTALAMQLFGKQGAAMLPFLNKGAAGMADLQKQAAGMGLTLDDTSMRIFGNAKKSAREFKLAVQGAGTAVGQDFSVPLDAVANISRAILIPALHGLVTVAHAFRPAFLVIGEIGDKVAEKLRGLATKAFTPLAAHIAHLAGPTTTFLKRFEGVGETVGRVGDRLLSFAKGSTGQAIGSLLKLWQAVSPLGIAFKALLPVLPSLLSALKTLGAVVAGALGAAIRAVLPAVITLAGIIAHTLAKAVVQLAPVIAVLAKALGGALGASLVVLLPVVAQVALVLVNLLSAVLGLLQPLLTSPGVILAVAGAFAAWKLAQAGISFAGMIGGLIKTTAQLALNTIGWVKNAAALVVSKAQTVILLGMYAGEFVGNMVKATAALALQVVQWGLHAVAAGASAVATGAMTVASGVATAAQWALNAALNANPIGLVVLAIAALVAGLVWFFTQTKLGKAVWQDIVNFLQAAWATLSAAAATVWKAIVGAVTGAINGVRAVVSRVIGLIVTGWRLEWAVITTVVRTVWNAITGAVRTAVNAVHSVIARVIGLIVAGWRLEWAVITTVVRTVWNTISGAVHTAINAVHSVIARVIGLIVTGWRLEWAVITAVVHTVWSAISGAVRNAINTVHSIISGVLGTIRKVWSAGWSAVSGFLGGVWSKITGAVSTGIAAVVGLARSIGGKILSAVSGFGQLLYTAGSNLLKGLVGGVQSMVKAVIGTVTGMANNVVNTVKHLFGIKSPSTVFKAIGAFLGQGLVLGVQGTHAQVSSAMVKLTGLVSSAFDKLAAQRSAAQVKLKRLDQQYADTSTLTAAGRKRHAELGRQVKEQGALLAQLTRLDSKSTETGVTKALRLDNAKLAALSKTRDGLTAKLKTAQDGLTAALSTRNDYAKTVGDGVAGLGNVTSVQGKTDAAGVQAKVNAGDILGSLRAQVAAAGKFRAELQALQAQGLNGTTYRQLVDSFTSNGDTSTADALTAGGRGSVAALNALQAQLSQQAAALGKSTSAALYQGSVDAAQAQVTAAKARVADVTGAIGLVEAQVGNSAKKLGVDVKPLMRQAGSDLVTGLTDGLKGKHTELGNAIAALGKKAVAAIKKELHIKAPAHAAGVTVGTHLAAGVAAVHSTGPSAHSVTAPKAHVPAHPAAHAAHGAQVVQNFNGPMGYTAEQVAGHAATKARRAVAAVNVPKVVVK